MPPRRCGCFYWNNGARNDRAPAQIGTSGNAPPSSSRQKGTARREFSRFQRRLHLSLATVNVVPNSKNLPDEISASSRAKPNIRPGKLFQKDSPVGLVIARMPPMREPSVLGDPGERRDNLSGWLMYLVIFVGLMARMLVATYGHNYDMDSYRIIAGIMDHGGNVYAETPRYNYGPVWFQTIHAIDLVAGHQRVVFRYFMAGFLSLVDVGIFFVLWKKYGRAAAAFFFLNPISVIITGYHSQFDNLAVLLGLFSVLLMQDDFDKPVGSRKFCGLLVLGLSLMTKHLLFVFPFWLAVKQKGLGQKAIVVMVPILVFLAGFAPYWHDGSQGIIANVFQYKSANNEYFYKMFVPQGLQCMFSGLAVWFFSLAVFAFLCRKKTSIESLLLYTAVLVATSPAIANQYLATPIPFVATHMNPFTILFTGAGVLHLLVDVNGFNRVGLTSSGCADIAVSFLFFGWIWVVWRAEITALFKRCVLEIEKQWSGKE